jgi:hypothetical protein
LLRDEDEKAVKSMTPTPKAPAMFLDEGLRIGGRGRLMNSKVNQNNKVNIVVLLKQS